MPLRLISASILIPAALALVFFAPPGIYLAVIAVVGTFCLYEYFRIMERMGFRGQPWLGYISFWILIKGLSMARIPAEMLCAAVLVITFLAAMWRRESIRDRVHGLMANVLGVYYLAFSLYPAVAVRFRFGDRQGLEWTLILLVVLWVGDTAALLGGRLLGRTPFASMLSPKKTNEGAVAGLLGGVLAAVLLRQYFFSDLPLGHVAAASLLIAAFGQLGDLAESMLKRAAEVKESSGLIPGHGGVLDRVDSMLFALPVLYLYLLILYTPMA